MDRCWTGEEHVLPSLVFRPCFGKGTEQGGNNVVVHVASAGGR